MNDSRDREENSEGGGEEDGRGRESPATLTDPDLTIRRLPLFDERRLVLHRFFTSHCPIDLLVDPLLLGNRKPSLRIDP